MVSKNKKNNFFFDFTIITIVKNDEKNIENTIKSVLSQKKIKVQYIVLDGHSSDKTYSIIKKYKKKIKVIKYKDKSFYDGLNYSLKFVKGRFIGILNSGDLYFNENVLNFINQRKANSDFFYGKILYYNNNLDIVRNWDFNLPTKKKYYFYYIPHTSLFISLNIMQNYLKIYNPKYKISSDTELMIRLNLIKNLKFKKINKYIIFMKTGGLSTNLNFAFKKTCEDLLILKTFFKYFFLIYYLKKIFIKIKSFYFIKNKLNLRKKLSLTIKSLSKIE